MGIVTVRDGTQIHYKDWGSGPPVVLSHGWPLSSDSITDTHKEQLGADLLAFLDSTLERTADEHHRAHA